MAYKQSETCGIRLRRERKWITGSERTSSGRNSKSNDSEGCGAILFRMLTTSSLNRVRSNESIASGTEFFSGISWIWEERNSYRLDDIRQPIRLTKVVRGKKRFHTCGFLHEIRFVKYYLKSCFAQQPCPIVQFVCSQLVCERWGDSVASRE